ncbi:MAG: hypothetical protein AB9842_08145 [Bacteroidales bacterium]
MRPRLLIILSLLFLILGFGLGAWTFNKFSHSPDPVTITDTIPGDSIPVEIILPAPDPVYIDTGSFRIIYDTIHDTVVDLKSVLKDYFSLKLFDRVLRDDSSVFVRLLDSVTQNRLLGSKLFVQNKRATVINTTLPISGNNKPVFCLGVTGIFSREKEGIAPAVLYLSGKGNGLSYAYDPLNRQHAITAWWRVGQRQKVPP